MDDSTDARLLVVQRQLADVTGQLERLQASNLDLEDALKRAESQAEVLENFCFGLERDHELARRQIEERDALIFAELEQAQRFQLAMLESPTVLPEVTLEAVYRPVSQVGGDFYDVALVDRAVLRIFVADATGHGLKAALQTMLIKAEYEAANIPSAGPGAVLTSLNAKVSRAYRGIEVIFTAIVADVELVTGRVRYASAAHPSPFALMGGHAVELPDVPGSFIGLSESATFAEHEVTLAPGDTLVLVSDGITEAYDAQAGDFGEARVLAAMHAAKTSNRSVAKEICAALDAFLRGSPADDDVTLVALTRT